MRKLLGSVWFWIPLAGFLAGLILYIWLFAQVGTLGTFRYSYARPIMVGVALGFLIPLILMVAWASTKSQQGDNKTLRWLALITGLIAIFAALTLFLRIYQNGAAIIPNLDSVGPILIDPAAGITPKPRTDPNAPILRIALSSDAHVDAADANHAATRLVLSLIGSGDYDAFFALGDTTETGMNTDGWALARTWFAAGLGTVPIRPIMGNHDTILANTSHYRAAFFPEGMRSDSGSFLYYSVDAGPIRFIVINLLWGTEDFDATERAWFEHTLATVPPGKQIVVLSHCFMYASGFFHGPTGVAWYDKTDTIREITPLLEKYKVSLSIAGHNHYMEYLRHAKVGYAIIGALGGHPDPVRTYTSPASIWFQQGLFGYLELLAWPDHIELNFIDSQGQTVHHERVENPRLPLMNPGDSAKLRP